MKNAVILSLVAILVAAPAFAGNKIVLDDPVIYQSDLKAWGMASIDVRKGVEFYDVRIDVGLKDGSEFVVAIKRKGIVTADATWIDVGKMELLLGTATLSLNSKQHISPVFPVRGISEVAVKYRGRVILKGTF